ncbi:MAG: hypothetical protein ABSG94_02260 [Brevinematales bacterium]|jgi:hypothetical protein
MAPFFNLLVFLFYKAGIIGIFYFALQYFNLRFDVLVLYFYLLLSLFQFLFIIFQVFSGSLRKRNKGKEAPPRQFSAIFQYTPVIVMLMEFLILAMSCYYLYKLENDFMTLLLIFTVFIPVNTIYYYLQSMFFTVLINRKNVRIPGASVFPFFIYMAVIFLEPAAYIFFKYFYIPYKGAMNLKILNSSLNISVTDLALFALTMIINGIFVFLFIYYKEFKAKKIYTMIKSLSLLGEPGKISIDDGNEFGYIETGLTEFQDSLKGRTENLLLLNGYISKNIREEIDKSGLVIEGEEKTAAVATIRFGFSLREYSPEKYISLVNSIFRVIGQYADEYEAYPFFQLNKAVIVYGMPYYYAHEKLNAIEATQEMIADIWELVDNEGGTSNIHSGIYSGTIITGAFETKGMGLKEYAITGSAIDISERIALAAENIDAKILVEQGMLDGLNNKFYPDKTFKLKIKNSNEILVTMLKV